MEQEKPAACYEAYLSAMEQKLALIGEEAGHEIASLVLSLKFGLWTNVKKKATGSANLLGDDETASVLKKALSIVNEQMPFISKHLPPVSITKRFDPQERRWLAVTSENTSCLPAWHLDNAVVLLYTAAYSASVTDREALDEQRNYVLSILEPYLEEEGETDEMV